MRKNYLMKSKSGKKIIFSGKEIINRKALELIILILIYLVPSISADAENEMLYSFVCPFFTDFDSISEEEFIDIWTNGVPIAGKVSSIAMTEETFGRLSIKFGNAHSALIKIRSQKEIAERLERIKSTECAIVPTNDLQPNWKQISIGEQASAPWDQDYDVHRDLLAVSGEYSELDFDPEKITTVLLTGTTALARTTAYKMIEKGITYPGEKIRDIFENSEIRHISNESSFWSVCPTPILASNGKMQFCTPASFIDLFDYLGVNVVELTGNHLRDYDWPPLSETFQILKDHHIRYYGAGKNKEDAAEVLFIEESGNKFAFLGCNIAGPEHVFADENLPGVNRCDMDTLEKQVSELHAAGYLVIVTLQYYEAYSRTPTEQQEKDFQRISDAGAVVVSGSQAHFSQTMKPFDDRFIHYGLGNLFFDQMDRPVVGTREEFLDRYVFYDGKLIQVELITALLEDYAQPVPMKADERQKFLKEIFSYVK